MRMTLSEGDFHKLGFAIDPDDHSKAIPFATLNESLPDETWGLDRLALYASKGLAEAYRLDQEAVQLGRRSTVQIFRSGRALSIARKRLKSEGRGRWGKWLQEHNLKRTTVWESAELFERAGSEEEVAKLTPAEAKIRFGITKPPVEEDYRSADRRLHNRPRAATEPLLEEEEAEGDEDADQQPSDVRELSEDLPSETDRLAFPPRTVREILSAAYSLLAECQRRSVEFDSTCLSLIAEVVEIATLLSKDSSK